MKRKVGVIRNAHEGVEVENYPFVRRLPSTFQE